MKALTLWQPWASLVVIGAKPYEFRGWPAPRSLVGERIVIHAAKRALDMVEVRSLCAQLGSSRDGTALTVDKARPFLDSLREAMKSGAGERIAPLGAGLGSAVLGKPVRCVDLYPGREDIDENKWAWPMLDPQPFDRPIYCKGAQGFWEWQPVGQLL